VNFTFRMGGALAPPPDNASMLAIKRYHSELCEVRARFGYRTDDEVLADISAFEAIMDSEDPNAVADAFFETLNKLQAERRPIRPHRIATLHGWLGSLVVSPFFADETFDEEEEDEENDEEE
jgi:hypothetical protein